MGLLINSLHHTIDPDDARDLASVMIATVDGLLIQTFIDPDNAPNSHDLATAAGHTPSLEQSHRAVRP